MTILERLCFAHAGDDSPFVRHDDRKPLDECHYFRYGEMAISADLGERRRHVSACGLYQLVKVEPALEGPRDGDTFDPDVDLVPLNRQMLDVYRVMRFGDWFTLERLAELVGSPQTSISARLRDFRKPRFGGHTVERNRRKGNRVYEYRLVWNDAVARPELKRQTTTVEA